MSLSYFLIQLLNAFQYGLILYLVASGLALLLGVMGVINLAHGAFYMVGAYVAFSVTKHVGSLWLALPLGLVVGLLLGAGLEILVLSRVNAADHLSQVLLSFGLILLLNEGQRIVFGSDAYSVPVPGALDFSIPLSETLAYPAYRLFVCAVGIAFVAGLSVVMRQTRTGMMLRASAEDREMARTLGVRVKLLYLGVTAVGIACAVLAGVIAAPLASVYPGMGDQMLILSFVIVVLGGMGSLNGALVSAMLLGLIDSFGKHFMPNLSGFVVYAAMVFVLILRPRGLSRGAGA